MLASKIKKEIKEDIREKFILLEIDIATRMDRAILGTNIQLIKNGKLTLRTKAMKKLTHRHTAEYIKNTVGEVLEQYKISVSQIYTVTTDNGANMLKSVKLLSNEQLKENAFADEDSLGTAKLLHPIAMLKMMFTLMRTANARRLILQLLELKYCLKV